ncbi:hypothetical protein [Spirosoma sp. KNUC1025]|uniref:hypothetical protein n=1 Tax=Spirosoma sp. KNUC1025 TaxID=2894082 RepID=UPI001E4E6B02|nr:hypothetical protein [Spirosoma sp. KNUC1025]UFH57995.1 hypothetical protein LN737_32105 [Spirosoma sp. KNUC1025]
MNELMPRDEPSRWVEETEASGFDYAGNKKYPWLANYRFSGSFKQGRAYRFCPLNCMDNETIKQDIYLAIHELLALEPTVDNETITTLFTRIKVFADELPVYPNPQTQPQVDAYNLAHGQSEADLLFFSPENTTEGSIGEREATLERLKARAQEIESLLRADS